MADGEDASLVENIIIELDEYWDTNFLRACTNYDLVVSDCIASEIS